MNQQKGNQSYQTRILLFCYARSLKKCLVAPHDSGCFKQAVAFQTTTFYKMPFFQEVWGWRFLC